MDLTTNGGVTTCDVDGSGPPLVMIHGFDPDRTVFRAVVPYLRDRWTVITYDQRDTGTTAFPAAPYSISDLADDLADLIGALGYQHAHVLGMSFGGTIAQELVLRRPARVDRLILAMTSRNSQYVARLSEEVKAVMSASATGDPDATRQMAAIYFDPASLERDPSLLDAMLMARPVRTEAQMARRQGALSGFDSAGRLTSVQIPTLVIHGRNDRVVLAEESLAMALEIPDAMMVMLSGVGHVWYAEAPERTAGLVTTFLAGDL
jgi:3-oxoadipate enol-lactonase